MKRYRLPEGTVPGEIPTDILEHADPALLKTYMALHALASVQGDWGPFTPAQMLELVPSGTEVAPASVQVLEDALQRLAELEYLEVQYLS